MNDNNFGYNLKYLRKCFSLNQEELAKISGKSYASVSRWESGINIPPLDVVNKIRNHFGLYPSDLLYRKLDDHTPTDETSDLFRLLYFVEQMDENQFARLLAFREGLCRSTK